MNLYLSKNDLAILETKKIVLLVSGGSDSVSLFHLFLGLKERHHLAFSVLHFNHGLRGRESDADEHFVRNLCSRHDVSCQICRFTGITKKGLQEKARALRFAACARFDQEQGPCVFVLAHHADDVLETILMRQLRGTGLAGLAGIRRWQFLESQKFRGKLVLFRPLLGTFKAELEAFLETNHLAHRQDASNLTNDYLRNRIRHTVTDAWNDLEAKKQILSLATAAQVIDAYFELREKQVCRQFGRFIPRTTWDQWPSELAFRIFRAKMAQNGFRQQIEQRHFQLCKKLSLKLCLGSSSCLGDESGYYFLDQCKTLPARLPDHRISGPGAYHFGPLGCGVTVRIFRYDPAMVLPLAGDNHHLRVLFMDAQTVTFPLFAGKEDLNTLFLPFGHKNPIPLKKFFQDCKVPQHARRFWPVIKDEKGFVVAVLGLEIAEPYRVTADTKRVCQVCYCSS